MTRFEPNLRIPHRGSVATDDIIAAIGVLQATAIECCVAVAPGAAVAAAQRVPLTAQEA